ncbi:DMT family transporter [Ideonella sp.]|jgi:drug/metabolite transporter (DMT)-like permease|uniref:DMT family transporter n=1 Tax=Ideonella sp. TaxID=1929293 RepID=UPI0037C0F288
MTDRRAHLDLFAMVCLVGCAALWGLNQTATKIALAEIPPLLQAGVRSLCAAVLLAGWIIYKKLDLAPGEGHWAYTWRGGLLTGCLFAAEFACIFIGLQYTTASRMVVFVYFSPLVVAAAMPLVAPQEKLHARQVLGLLGAFAGLVWAFSEGFHTPTVGDKQWLGDALGACAAVLWAGTTLSIRGSRLATALPEQTLMYQLVVSGVALAGAGWLSGELWPAQISALAWGSLAFQIVIVTFASYLLWFWLIRHYAAATISAFTLLTPVFGLLFGVWLLNDPLTDRLLLALVAVAGGIGLVSWPRRA